MSVSKVSSVHIFVSKHKINDYLTFSVFCPAPNLRALLLNAWPRSTFVLWSLCVLYRVWFLSAWTLTPSWRTRCALWWLSPMPFVRQEASWDSRELRSPPLLSFLATCYFCGRGDGSRGGGARAAWRGHFATCPHDSFFTMCFVFVPLLLRWMRQLLAGMIAEPAFLSEYTIFALDSSKQPKTQTDSVVSPSTAFCIPPVGKQRNLVILEAHLLLLVAPCPSKHLQCPLANPALKNQSKLLNSDGWCVFWQLFNSSKITLFSLMWRRLPSTWPKL